MSLDNEVDYMSGHGKKKGNVHDIPIPGIEYVKGGATAFKERAAAIHDPETDDFIEDAIERAKTAMDMGEAYQRFKSVLEDQVTEGFKNIDHSYFQELDTHLRTKFNPLNPKTKMKGKVADKYMGEMLKEIVFPAAFGGTTDRDLDQCIKDFTNYAVAAHGGDQRKASQTVGTVKKLIQEGRTLDAYQQIEDIMKTYMISEYGQDIYGSLMPTDDMEVSKAMTKTLADKFGEAYKGKRTIDEGYILPKVQQLFQQYHINKSAFLKQLHEDGEEHEDHGHQKHAAGDNTGH